MNGQNIKKYQQEELNLVCLTCKKTRNYIFPLPRDKSWENWICKNELIFDFRGQNETEYNRIFILLLKSIKFKKTQDLKGEKHM